MKNHDLSNMVQFVSVCFSDAKNNDTLFLMSCDSDSKKHDTTVFEMRFMPNAIIDHFLV